MTTSGLLLIHDYRLWVHLGCSAEERQVAQDVFVSVRLQFPSLPVACESDRLSDTICYVRLCEAMKEISHSKHFQTIEHLACELHSGVCKFLSESVLVGLRLHKIHPPVEGLTGGVSFQMGDWA